MSTFVLVHGAWHGAWCWERLTPELERRGHRVVAVDLPSDDPAATFDDYAEAVVAAMGAATDPIVVGHSLSGNVLPLVARRAPVRHAVYLCAMIPDPGRSQSDQERAGGMTDPAYLKGLRRTDGCTVWADADLARELLYQDCAADVAAAAVARLRPQAYGPPTEVWPSGPLPAVPATAIVCAEDRILHPDWSRRVAPERLTAAVLELPGGHSPFLSRPAELAEALHGLG
ncbi:alpha/beta hydrolase [[Mycobacterium] wendilense]|uniref:Alpha/beta hydrolase n=1 Tax=[Mycobacterium] wendilense TaxID=3064284 RepID=A0ABM9MF89_9MYCO|nr:alpha/beta hydrolase [Mycolicibacterium sp. MU0050]CAJ1583753.1 alpha/beta hydrolase [Mycolicibacterium sp. MU0050]